MVVSKKCKVCTALNADIVLSEEYFDKSLPVLIEKISGMKLDPRKINGVLLCKLCAIQLVQADVFIDKVRNTLQRLTKLVKETKPKATSKDDSLVNRKEYFENSEAYGNLTTPSKMDLNENSPQAHTSKKTLERETDIQNAKEGDKPNDGIEKDVPTTENKKIEQKAKTPKKVGQKSVLSKGNLTDNKDDIQKNCEEMVISSIKFKKIADEQTTVKSAQAYGKRKEIFTEAGVECENNKLNNVPTPAKRNSLSILAFDGNHMDIDTEEQSYNESSLAEVETKIMNCVICGKGFSQKASLREHIESSHMGEKLKRCPNCSTEFRSQQKYETHVFKEKCKNSKHVCQYPKCNRRFKTIHRMELHMQEKHISSQQESEVE